MAAPPSRNDNRIIVHFDYDCFYASVFEVEQPVLKSLPLAVQQKQIVVTCNYEARRRGLRKLQLIKEAKKICPDVVIVLGEDLTKFRDASKELYVFLKSFIWGNRVEKLGFDEVFLDVTDMIEYNVELLNKNGLDKSFFYLDRQDPIAGFPFDATNFHGPTWPALGAESNLATPPNDPSVDSLRIRLLVASHLAGYLRSQLEHHKGYTATVGVSTNKLLAKLAGNIHKPNSQTTLLPPYVSETHGIESNVMKFLDDYEIRKIPGIGSKLAHKLRTHVVRSDLDASDSASDKEVTVRDVRLFPGMGPLLLDRILGGPGAPKDIGTRVWGLIHGVDDTEVLEARDTPTQISIEDSYGRLDTLEEVRKVLVTLAASLIRRMRTDLTERDTDPNSTVRWIAHPRTLRLSTRPRPPPSPDGTRTRSFNRISRSGPLPQFIFNLDDSIDALAERLVREGLLSMFRKLHPERSGWNLSLMNIAVTNMVGSAGEQKQSSGRDIEKMFRRQEAVLKDWKATDPEPQSQPHHPVSPQSPPNSRFPDNLVWEESDEDETMPSVPCVICGASVPQFAQVAHELYHSAIGRYNL